MGKGGYGEQRGGARGGFRGGKYYYMFFTAWHFLLVSRSTIDQKN
jgi:hypothetical protein